MLSLLSRSILLAILLTASISSKVTTQQERDDTSRASLNANHVVFKPNKRFVDYFGTIEKNDELGLDLRALLGAEI